MGATGQVGKGKRVVVQDGRKCAVGRRHWRGFFFFSSKAKTARHVQEGAQSFCPLFFFKGHSTQIRCWKTNIKKTIDKQKTLKKNTQTQKY